MGHSACSVYVYLIACLSLQAAEMTKLVAAAEPPGNETDQQALLEFKAKIMGEGVGIKHVWNTTTHFCQWYGVTCGRRHQRVTKMELKSLHIAGSITPYLGNLSFLKVLDLEGNSLSGEIPQEVGRLRRLRILRLSSNSIGGEIPVNISGCSRLTSINVSYNLLTGKIPPVLGHLKNLQEVYLYHNGLQGSIPSSLVNLSSLEILSLSRNQFTGDIPEAIGHLKNLVFFSVAENHCSGVVPPSIFNLSHMRILDVGTNQMEGSLPSDLGTTLPKLEVLALTYNSITGNIPPSIANSSNLIQLEVGANKLTGNLPDFGKLNKLQVLATARNQFGTWGENDLRFLCSLTNATGLQMVNINNNKFGGKVPECIANLSTDITLFTLDHNKISGIIPSGLENLVNLEALALSENEFNGRIPYGIGKLQKLRELYLGNNSLSGSIPSSIGNLTMLTKLSMAWNNLQGSIPPSLANCTGLIGLDVSRNNLSGPIPPQIFTLSSLSITLDLSVNRLTGNLPLEVKSLINLQIFTVAENLLTGEIPSSLGSCVELEIIDMSDNCFEGKLPSSLRSIRGIEVLDLARNNLTGEIPRFLLEFHFLQILYLDNNDFEGVVPSEGIFTNITATSVDGNKKLCGGIPEFHLPRCNLPVSNKKGFKPLKLFLSILFSILGVALVSSLLFLCWLKRKRKVSTSSSKPEHKLRELSYQTLVKATEGFSLSNLIGVGSYGSVYRGSLDQGRSLVAVKVLDLLRRGASKSFLAECEALRNIRHRNLLKIETVCSSVDNNGNDFKALVYEFMANGSLEEWLHPNGELTELNDNSRNLNLLQRLSIAIDVACALDYLHHHCETLIVHCDIKPSNVLLDDGMTGHLGDFGLVRILPEALQNSSEHNSSTTGIKGTVGYIAPEYGMGSEASTYGDVYSYGILLLEVFTGKRPTQNIFENGFNLHNFVKRAFPERAVDIVDPSLLSEYQEHTNTGSRSQFQLVQECLATILGIGLTCSSELPIERMTINDVVAQLSLVRDKLTGAGKHGRSQFFSTPNLADPWVKTGRVASGAT